MISSKHFSKIAITLTAAVLIACILAMCFSGQLFSNMHRTGYAMEYETALFDTDHILEVNIIMDDDQWNDMLDHAIQENYYQCDVVINGTTFYQVGIRPKGNTSLSSIANDPDNNRYSFKLEFDQFVDGQTCFGLDKLILNNNYADTTNMKEAIVYDMFRFLDADASLYNYAKISVNGEYWGVYLALEAIEQSFMLRNYGTKRGYLYKPDSLNHDDNNDHKETSETGFPSMPEGGFPMPDFQKSEQNSQTSVNAEAGTEKASERDDIRENTDAEAPTDHERENEKSRSFPSGGMPGGGERMGRGGMPKSMGRGGNLNYTDDDLDSYSTIWDGQVNNSSDTDHKRVVEALKHVHDQTDLEQYIDVDQFLKYMAVHNFSVNEDSLSGSMAHNYYLYESNGQISILPWDYNLSFGGMHGGDGTSVINDPIDDTWSATQLFDFVLENEAYKARYHEYYSKLITEYLYGGEFEKTYNRIRAQIDSLVELDPNAMYTYEEYLKGVELFYEAVMLRTESVKGQLDGSIPSTFEGQQADSSALVDASHINLSDLGQFMNGGGLPGGGNRQRDGSGQNSSDSADFPSPSGEFSQES